MLFGLFGESRSLENPSVSLTDPTAWNALFNTPSGSGVNVTEESALGVTAIWQAVNLISGTLAHLPFHLFKIDGDGNMSRATTDPLYRVIHDQANDIHTKPDFYRWLGGRLLLEGRAFALIVRNKAGRVTSLIPLEGSKVEVTQSIVAGRLSRTYKYDKKIAYQSNEILDFNLYPRGDGLSHFNPLNTNREAIGLVIAAERYAASLFAGGGVPPLTLTGTLGSPQAQERAGDQINAALQNGRDRKRNIVQIPTGFELKPLAFDPSKNQLVELRQFMVAEVSRIFNVPPSMLFDLTHGTYSNTEQQNLAFSQHTMTPILELVEAEMNAKLFGARNTSNFVEFDMGGLLRGDLLSRTEALARAVNSALLTPNEARALDNREAKDGGDDLLIQGATVPLSKAGQESKILA